MRYFYLLLGLFGIAALNLVRPMHGFTSSGFSSEEHDEADDIVRRSYANSYARLLPCNDYDDDDGNAKGAGKGELWNPKLWKSCVVRNLAHFNNTNSTAPSIPWWLLTLLRDTQRNMAYGPWHRFGTTEPPLNFCAIEKVGSTEWRRVFCDANADDCVREPKRCTAFRGKKCAFMTTRSMPKDAPWAVFLRDPLERILSGFLDKCYNAETRKIQGHCEPNVLFNPRPNMRDARGENYPSLMEHLEGKDKQFFAAYLDVFPGEWNIHFLPQAISCNLHRNIDRYDFVGNMGEEFLFDVKRMASQFSDRLPELLNASFGYMEYEKAKENRSSVTKHATYAPGKVRQFYTAQTVRRGLELMSIDYVRLGLKVPEWARQMLREEVS